MNEIVKDGVVLDEEAFLAMGGTVDEDGRLDYNVPRAYRNQEVYAAHGARAAARIDYEEWLVRKEAAERTFMDIMRGWEDEPEYGTKTYTAAGPALVRS